jgi:hypothetical protein
VYVTIWNMTYHNADTYIACSNFYYLFPIYTILIATMFTVSFAMAICSKIYDLCFRSAGKDAYHV